MKHKWLYRSFSLMMLGAMLCTTAFASELQSPAQTDDGVVHFEEIESLVYANNSSAQALSAAITSLNSFNRKKAYDDLLDTYNSLADVAFYDSSLSGQAAISMEQATLKESLESLKEENYAKSYEDTVLSLQSGINQIVQAGQNTYIGISLMNRKLEDANRGMETMARAETRLNLMHALGLASDMDLQALQNQKAMADSQISSLKFQIETYLDNLKLLLGEDLEGTLTLGGLEAITEEQIVQLDFNADLETGLAANLDCYQARRAVEDAKDDWDDAGYNDTVARNTYESTVYRAGASESAFKMQAETIYRTLSEKCRLVKSAQANLLYEQKNFDSLQIKYQVGLISKYDLDNAQSAVADKQAAVAEEQVGLYSAWVAYQWMTKGLISDT